MKNYFAGQLFAGKQTNEFTLLNQGVADFAFGSTINWSPQVKELNLFAMPFLYPSYKAQDAVEDGEPGQKLFKLIEAKGVIPLAWGENGFREVTNSKRAVRKPEDLEGLKIRVVGSPIFIDIFRALGANPVNMNWGEAQTAFQQGTVDGQENPVVSVIIPSKLWTAQKHITLWHYVIDPLVLGVSKLTWDSLTPGRPRDREEDGGGGHGLAEEGLARRPRGLARRPSRSLKKNGMEVVEALSGGGGRLPGEDAPGLRQVGERGRRRPREVRREPSSRRRSELGHAPQSAAAAPARGIAEPRHHLAISWPSIVELVGHSQMFDYVEFVAEYAPYDLYALENLGRAIDLFPHMTGMTKIEQEPRTYLAVRALGSGIQNLLFADVRTVADARECVRATRAESPATGGIHGVGMRRDVGFVLDIGTPAFVQALEDAVVALMIEKKPAVEDLDGILSVPGIDMVQFGPADYAMSIGLPGQWTQGRARPNAPRNQQLSGRVSAETGPL